MSGYTLKEHLLQLRSQLNEVDKKLKQLDNLVIQRNKLLIAIEIAEKSIPTIELLKKEENSGMEQDMIGLSIPDAIVKFLSETEKSYTVLNITRSILARGVKSNYKSAISTVRSSLTRLSNENKVKKRGLGYWSIYPLSN